MAFDNGSNQVGCPTRARIMIGKLERLPVGFLLKQNNPLINKSNQITVAGSGWKRAHENTRRWCLAKRSDRLRTFLCVSVDKSALTLRIGWHCRFKNQGFRDSYISNKYRPLRVFRCAVDCPPSELGWFGTTVTQGLPWAELRPRRWRLGTGFYPLVGSGYTLWTECLANINF